MANVDEGLFWEGPRRVLLHYISLLIERSMSSYLLFKYVYESFYINEQIGLTGEENSSGKGLK